jgi:hypothetical protein
MKNEELNPKLKKDFEDLRKVTPRDSQSAARGRLQFLHHAHKLSQGVSPAEKRRHKGWNSIFPFLFPLKEQSRMKQALISTALVVTVFLAVGGTTVYAAQDDIPGQNLYQVKTWSENTAMNLTMSEQTRLEYALDFADRRVAEAAGLVSAGLEVPEQLETRLRTQLEQALHLAAGLDDTQMLQQLENIRLRSENQVQIMNMLMTNAPECAQPVLQRIRDRFSQQIQLVELGQADPQAFKAQVQNGPGAPGPNGTQNQNSIGEPGPNGTQNQNGSGAPGPNGTQNQVGTGEPGPNGTQNQNGSGALGPNGTQDQNQSGPGEPQATESPGNYGPGPGIPDPGKGTSKP